MKRQWLSHYVKPVDRNCWEGHYFHKARSLDADIIGNITVNKGY